MDASSVVAGLLHELSLPDQVLSLLLAHAQAVAREADRLGLVSDRDVERVLLRHTADSLLVALARRPAAGERWVDVGSGAGFPGLVLAAAFPATRFVLLEPQQRRAGFLDLQILTLGLTNAEVLRQRLEQFPRSWADVIVARALDRPHSSLLLLQEPLVDGGMALILGGPGTPAPAGATIVDVARPSVESPGMVFMMAKEPRV